MILAENFRLQILSRPGDSDPGPTVYKTVALPLS